MTKNKPDLIDRGALLDSLKESYSRLREIYDSLKHDEDKQICAGQLTTFTEAILSAKEAPSVDAVEVVRCKDCFKRNDPSRCPMCYDEWYYDDDDGSDFIRQDNTIDDGFCHVGAKMDGGKQDA